MKIRTNLSFSTKIFGVRINVNSSKILKEIVKKKSR